MKSLLRFTVYICYLLSLVQCYGYSDIDTSLNATNMSLIFFGDSLLDSHNFVDIQKQETNGTTYFNPPYSKTGAITNGLALVDFIKGQLQKANRTVNIYNYAVAGSTATNTSISPCEFIGSASCPVIPKLRDQVQQYLDNLGGAPVPLSHVLFLQIGATDFVDVKSLQSLADKIDNFTVELNASLSMLFERNATTIMLSTLPPGQKAPAASNSGLSTQLEVAIKLFNRKLNQTAAALSESHPEANITVLELYDTVGRLIDDLENQGWNTTAACLDLNKYRAFYIDEVGAIRNATANATDIANMTCTTPCRTYFWDGVHPSSCAYAKIAGTILPNFISAVDSASAQVQEGLQAQNDTMDGVKQATDNSTDQVKEAVKSSAQSVSQGIAMASAAILFGVAALTL